jgi:Alcohol dehydrogenase GroES-like domain
VAGFKIFGNGAQIKPRPPDAFSSNFLVVRPPINQSSGAIDAGETVVFLHTSGPPVRATTFGQTRTYFTRRLRHWTQELRLFPQRRSTHRINRLITLAARLADRMHWTSQEQEYNNVASIGTANNQEGSPRPDEGQRLPRSRQFGLEEKLIPHAGPGEAVIEVRMTTICGTDIHIIRGEYPVKPGLTYEIGERVQIGAITPCGQCEPCLEGHTSQCGVALGRWRLGNTIRHK